MEHKAGYVNIIGNPNVGKSTLMNALIGEKLSIITPKAQTTRHRILGILNERDYQIIFSAFSYREETQPLWGDIPTTDGREANPLRQNSTPKRTLKDISLEPAVCILY